LKTLILTCSYSSGCSLSVVQATQSARRSKLMWYLGVTLAILFFGGFLVRSYWEDHVLERDTKKLLAYYHHVLPGSIADGDDRNARWIAYKFRGKKDKLWASLQKKYGEPIREANEWEDYIHPNAAAGAKDRDETIDMDAGEGNDGKDTLTSDEAKDEDGDEL
jgi:hypothetical protein